MRIIWVEGISINDGVSLIRLEVTGAKVRQVMDILENPRSSAECGRALDTNMARTLRKSGNLHAHVMG